MASVRIVLDTKGVAILVCKATELTEILSFSSYGLNVLCGKDVFYTLASPLPDTNPFARLKTFSVTILHDVRSL